MTKRIAVVVLSYNGIGDTLTCLQSLLQGQHQDQDPPNLQEPNLQEPDLQEPEIQEPEIQEIIVVDNASSDGSAASVAQAHPAVTLIALPENRGWAGGNNAGIAHALRAGADLVCLLNNDTIVPPGGIASLAATASRLGPCLLHPAIDYADPAEGPQLDPAQHIASGPFAACPGEASLFELGFAYGACLMIHAEIFAAIGLFDERFFLQLEETDFWLRAKAAGYRALCTGSIRIVHGESRSFGGRTTPLKSYYIVRNTLLLTEKHRRTPHAVFSALRSLCWTIAHLAEPAAQTCRYGTLGLLFSREPTLVAIRLGIRDYLGRRFGRIGEARRRSIGA